MKSKNKETEISFTAENFEQNWLVRVSVDNGVSCRTIFLHGMIKTMVPLYIFISGIKYVDATQIDHQTEANIFSERVRIGYLLLLVTYFTQNSHWVVNNGPSGE